VYSDRVLLQSVFPGTNFAMAIVQKKQEMKLGFKNQRDNKERGFGWLVLFMKDRQTDKKGEGRKEEEEEEEKKKTHLSTTVFPCGVDARIVTFLDCIEFALCFHTCLLSLHLHCLLASLYLPGM
jgi:hypothetical protein